MKLTAPLITLGWPYRRRLLTSERVGNYPDGILLLLCKKGGSYERILRS